MLFHSTRGGDKNRTFEDILMQGLASDGGLFMPDFWPQVDLESLANKSSFIDIAKEIVPLFTSSSFFLKFMYLKLYETIKEKTARDTKE